MKSTNRIPGIPDDKYKFLSKIDDRTLPHLIGDILFFTLGHKNVKVVDGPGDGKRDIFSIQTNDKKCITQCKYHNNYQKTVSSNETDELVLALNKFGADTGIFVTTGKISPQAKREYLDNYPNFTLDFYDGTNIVDIVLSSPLLSDIWFNNEKIEHLKSKLIIPLIIRCIKDDKPIIYDDFSNRIPQALNLSIDKDYFDVLSFEPFRSNFEKDIRIISKDLLCYKLTFSGRSFIYDIPNRIEKSNQFLSENIPLELLPVVVRYGTPEFTSNIKSELNDNVKLNTIIPTSFVIDKNKNIFTEKDWVVLKSTNDWTFPRNLSMAEAPWAGWLSRKYNAFLMEEITVPIFFSESYFDKGIRNRKEKYYEDSLFLCGSYNECEKFKKSLTTDDFPDWECEYGPNGRIIGWLHPLIKVIDNYDYSFRYCGEDNDVIVEPKHPINIEFYNNKVIRIKKQSSSLKLAEIAFNKVKHISIVNDNELFPDIIYKTYNSADLFHYFEDISSPVYLRDRNVVLIQMWQIKDEPRKARRLLTKNKLEINKEITIDWDARKGSKTNLTFIKAAICLKINMDDAINIYLENKKAEIEQYFEIISKHILSIWASAKNETIKFWNIEVGFTITEKEFAGNPWVISQNKDGQSILHKIKSPEIEND